MTQPRRHWPLRSRRIRALIAGLALVMLVLGLSGVRSTMAGWTDSEEAPAEFAAGSLGQVQGITCTDRGLLGGLLSNSVKLDWEEWVPPAGVDPNDVEYEIAWKESGVLVGSGTAVTSSTTYTYRSGLLDVLNLGVDFTVRAKINGSDWVGPPSQNVSAKGVRILILGVILRCQ